jgi:hypothetical protein
VPIPYEGVGSMTRERSSRVQVQFNEVGQIVSIIELDEREGRGAGVFARPETRSFELELSKGATCDPSSCAPCVKPSRPQEERTPPNLVPDAPKTETIGHRAGGADNPPPLRIRFLCGEEGLLLEATRPHLPVIGVSEPHNMGCDPIRSHGPSGRCLLSVSRVQGHR